MIVPFAGSRQSAELMVELLAPLRLGPADEAFIGDNSVDGVVTEVRTPAGWRVIRAPREGSCAHPRNIAALHASGEWLLFIDADTAPCVDLLERFFARPIPEDVGVVGGTVLSDERQTSLAARWADTRKLTAQDNYQHHPFRPFVIGACILVRRRVWRQVGGFLEGIFNAEDVDFCWRVQEGGWKVVVDPHAEIVHVHRERLTALLKQTAVRGASASWVHRRWPDAARPVRPSPLLLLRGAAAVPVLALMGQRERAGLRALDVATELAAVCGAVCANRARPRPDIGPCGTRRPIEVWCDEFPVVSETFVVAEARELAALGHPTLVVADRRPHAPALGVHDLSVRYLEDETSFERLGALAVVVARHPLACLRDLHDRGRWARQEPVPPLRALARSIQRLMRADDVHVHVHFAGHAALNALRATRIAGRTWSLTAHASDIYRLPRNLDEKLRAADLVTSGCDYTVRDLRRIAGADRAKCVHRIVMGVHSERFCRGEVHPAARRVLAVGRLVEKNGFGHLVRAAHDPVLAGALDAVVILGDGPLREELVHEIEELGLNQVVDLRGRVEQDEVREWLERAAVLAMPCVVAADGDRDSMPVAVKEALAMELPVVASEEVGLPELVRPEFGRLVPPGDPHALAVALRELLELAPEQRAAMGRAGRAFVTEHANVATETTRLSSLVTAMA